MSKVVPPGDIGVPVPSGTPDPTLHLIAYYGSAGFTPSYSQPARVDLGAISTLKTVTSGSPAVSYWDIPVSSILGSSVANGSYGFVFTLRDSNGNESDFSPPVSETVDVTVPPTLGQPVVL